MSKQLNKLNQIWYETSGEQIKIGLTSSFLDSLDECWHILPPAGRRIKERAPLFTVETNDSLVSVLSPVAGSFLQWNDRATNFPDKLRESDVILTLSSKMLEEEAPPTTSINARATEIARLDAIVANSFNSMNERIAAQTRSRELSAIQRAEMNAVRPGAVVAGNLDGLISAGGGGFTTARGRNPVREVIAGAAPTMNWGDIEARATTVQNTVRVSNTVGWAATPMPDFEE